MDALTVILTAILGTTVFVALFKLSEWVGQFFRVYRESGRYHIDFGRQHSERNPRQ